MNRAPRRSLRTSGFTLLELFVSLVIFGVIGYSLVLALSMSLSSEQRIRRVSDENEGLRVATKGLLDEIGSSSDANIQIAPLADGNHQVRFMLPIDNAGVPAWGVYDRSLGSTPATQNRLNWSIQYTVRDLALGGGQTTKQLVRQVLDDAQVVQKEKVIMQGLRNGGAVPPGFRMTKVGVMWEVTLYIEGALKGHAGLGAVFHVQARNV